MTGVDLAPLQLLRERPGGIARQEMLLEVGETIIGFWGVPPEGDVEGPPYGGPLCLHFPRLLYVLPQWPSDEITLLFEIPDDPGFRGQEVLLQALIGYIDRDDAAWTNCGSLVIE